MFGTTRGMLIPAGKVLLAVTVALAFGTPLAANADDGMVDVRTLPRLEGAVEDTARTEPHSLRYGVPTVVAITSAATRKLLAANGWAQYLRPMDEASRLPAVQKGPAGTGRVVHPGPRQAGPVGGVLHRDQIDRECAVSRRCDRYPVRRSPALSQLFHGRAGRGQSGFLPQGACRLRLVAPVGSGRRGGLAERAFRRQDRQRRPRLFQLRQSRRRLSATADHAVAAPPRRWQDQRRDPGRAVRAAAEPRTRQGIGRPAGA